MESESQGRPRPNPRSRVGGAWPRVEGGTKSFEPPLSQSQASLVTASVKSISDDSFSSESDEDEDRARAENVQPIAERHPQPRGSSTTTPVRQVSPADDTFAKQAADNFNAEARNVHAVPAFSRLRSSDNELELELEASNSRLGRGSSSSIDVEEGRASVVNTQTLSTQGGHSESRSFIFADPRNHRTIISIV